MNQSSLTLLISQVSFISTLVEINYESIESDPIGFHFFYAADSCSTDQFGKINTAG